MVHMFFALVKTYGLGPHTRSEISLLCASKINFLFDVKLRIHLVRWQFSFNEVTRLLVSRVITYWNRVKESR